MRHCPYSTQTGITPPLRFPLGVGDGFPDISLVLPRPFGARTQYNYTTVASWFAKNPNLSESAFSFLLNGWPSQHETLVYQMVGVYCLGDNCGAKMQVDKELNTEKYYLQSLLHVSSGQDAKLI